MKLAIISDTHFGDEACVLVKADEKGVFQLCRSVYKKFAGAVPSGTRYLVLIGDIFEFSIDSFDGAYKAARVFFEQVAEDKLVEEIIYVPGNHDFDLWYLTQHQVQVIDRLKAGKDPRAMRWSLPAVLDVRTNTKSPGLSLHKVNPLHMNADGTRSYGGLALDGLTGGRLRFSIAYPNLYLLEDDRTTLLTHGQYFDGYWQFGASLTEHVGGPYEKPPVALSLHDAIAANFPVSQLAGAGMGQAGRLSVYIRQVYNQVRNKELGKLNGYLKRVSNKGLGPMLGGHCYQPKRWAVDLGLWLARRSLMKSLGETQPARGHSTYLQSPEVVDHLRHFLRQSTVELNGLELGHKPITRLVFGHTHEVIAGDGEKVSLGEDELTAFNTGGWVDAEGAKQAAVFSFDPDDGGLSYTRICWSRPSHDGVGDPFAL